MLVERMTTDSLTEALIPLNRFTPFPAASDREAWGELQKVELNQKRSDYLRESADALLTEPWPQLPASLFAEFIRSGNRNHYEKPYFQRRANLALLVLAECMAYEGTYLDAIMDGLLFICEETTWSVPAHTLRREGDILQREDQQTLALFSCQTAAVLAEALYLLGAELDQRSPSLVARVRSAILNRIIIPVETYEEESFWWSAGQNNWTPWCAANILGAASLILEDRPRLARLIAKKLNPMVDRFLKKYPEDGCCDEGPMYWNVSPGALLLYLEHLYALTDGQANIYNEPLIHAMGTFICHAHLTGPWALNFADATPRFGIARGIVHRYGERIGSDAMKTLVQREMRGWTAHGAVTPLLKEKFTGGDLTYMLRELFWLPTTPSAKPLVKELGVWYPHTEVMVAREKTDDSEGFILAAKGGHNGENHNHNDVGHFILYSNGEPMIIDIGVATYTAQTFSDRRYELFFTNSAGHNVPEVDGILQEAGPAFKATDVAFTTDCHSTTLTLDLGAAYPESAGLNSLLRRLEMNSGTVTVTDTFSVSQAKQVTLNLYTPAAVTEQSTSLHLTRGKNCVRLDWDASSFESVSVEAIPLDDEIMIAAWGPSLTRLTFQTTVGEKRPSYTLRFAPK